MAPAASSAPPRLVLFVTAHPDDEAMFFAPAIAHFSAQAASAQRHRQAGGDAAAGSADEAAAAAATGDGVYLLCLSTGDAEGLGRVRAKELLAACAALGVPADSVSVVDDAELRDGMATEWPEAAVARAVEAELKRRGGAVGAVVTFDARGVSGHANHAAVHRGVAALLAARGRALGVSEAWQLATLNPLRKFSAALERLVAPYLAPRGALVVGGGSLAVSLRAMRAHASQWVWYRKLFVPLSSYTYVNTLAPLPVGG